MLVSTFLSKCFNPKQMQWSKPDRSTLPRTAHDHNPTAGWLAIPSTSDPQFANLVAQ